MNFNDQSSVVQVIGSLLHDNELLGSDQYPLNNDYFNNRLDVICYAGLYNVYNKGIRNINISHIMEFLTPYPDQLNYFLENNGEEYLTNAKINAQPINYEYYYNKLRKMYMLKTFDMYGFNVRELYNPDEQNENLLINSMLRLDSMSCDDISLFFEKRLSSIQDVFSGSGYNQGVHAGYELRKLYNSFKEAPEMGFGLNGNILNTIVRGARLKKLYCRSAPSGVGKTRTLAGCAAQLGVGTYYDIFRQEWVTTNDPQPTLYITSEQEYQEIQTLNIAFVSGVSEDKILDGIATPEEEERIFKAIELIENSQLYIEPIGDYGIRPLINLIKRFKQTKNISFVFHDYLHSSLTLMNEISSEARISNLREDQMLLMLCNSLKNTCNQLNIFVFTATQLNRSYKTEEKMDATVIRGSLSITDKLDVASVLMDIEEDELLMIKKLLENNTNMIIPNVVTHFFKNRRNKYSNIRLYSYLDKGTGQMLDLFVLDGKNQIVDIKPTQIIQAAA